MAVFLLILKIIGKILLGILLFILIALGLVLFVPVRYKLYAKKEGDEGPYAKANISWLLYLVNIKITYFNELSYIVRVLFFPIKKSDNLVKNKKKRKLSKNIKAKKGTKEESDNKETKPRNDIQKIDTEDNAENIAIPSSVDNNEVSRIEDSVKDDAEDKTEKKSFFSKIIEYLTKVIEFIFSIPEKIEAAINKVEDIKSNTDYYINIISDERNIKAIKLCYEKASKVISSILPKKINGNLKIGLDDPYSLGQILTIYSILYPYLCDKIQIEPDFENEILEGQLIIKGKIRVCILLWAGYKIYFNKDVRRLYKMLRRNK